MVNKNNKKRLLALGLSTALASTGAFVMTWEGKSNKAYLDIVKVPTICYGETKGVKLGDYKTDEQCDTSLAKELVVYNKQMLSYVKVPLTPQENAAYTSFVWNVGATAFKNSTLLKKLNNNQREEACNELLRWNKAGGKAVPGLTNRRIAENKLCLGKDESFNKSLGEQYE